MADEQFSGALGGAAQGAATGATIGSVVPGIGTAVGAVVGGIIGGIGGLFGGSKAKKARKYNAIAAKFEAKSAAQQAALARREMLRQSRAAIAQGIAFAASEEGGLQSSTSQGAIGSAQSNTGFNLGYLQNQATLTRGATVYREKAGKASNQAADIFGMINSVASAAQTIAPTIPQRPPGMAPTGTSLGAPIGGTGAAGASPAFQGLGLTTIQNV